MTHDAARLYYFSCSCASSAAGVLALHLHRVSTAPALKLGDVQVLAASSGGPCFGRYLLLSSVWTETPTIRSVEKVCRAILLIPCGVPRPLDDLVAAAFYPPPDVSFLKYPFLVSVSRLFELAIAVYFMTAVADTLSLRPRLIPLSRCLRFRRCVQCADFRDQLLVLYNGRHLVSFRL